MKEQHPSFFTLDRIALGLDTDESVQQHVEACDACAAHIARIGLERPVPAWANALESQARPQPRRLRMLWGSGLAGATAAVALAVTALQPGSPTSDPDYTTRRGAPAVGLYIKRGSRVSLWDGRRPVVSGDLLRLKVVPEGFDHIGVYAPTARQDELQLLFGSAIEPNQESLLPRAWEVDDAPGVESLTIVLARHPITEERVMAHELREQQRSDIWVRALRIPKESGDRDSSPAPTAPEGQQ